MAGYGQIVSINYLYVRHFGLFFDREALRGTRRADHLKRQGSHNAPSKYSPGLSPQPLYTVAYTLELGFCSITDMIADELCRLELQSLLETKHTVKPGVADLQEPRSYQLQSQKYGSGFGQDGEESIGHHCSD